MSYPTEASGWKELVPEKWILFDANAIISILKYEQKHIFNELKELGAEFVYINPVLLELMNTTNSAEKLERSKLLVDYDFKELPLNREEVQLASRIQKSLPLQCQPSPADLYLGGTLAKHYRENRLLLTANIKDFPLPIYTRKGYVLLQKENGVRILTFLCTDNSELVES